MKKIFFVLLTSLLSNSYAADCKVYGISDGPQKLDCHFKNLDLSLYCNKGSYFINSLPVISAYHQEVERGSVPLVFKTKAFELTVIIESQAQIHAQLLRGNESLKGFCL